MKTVKRALSLVLVLVMVLGVFAMNTSAEEIPDVSSVEIHFYHNGTDLNADDPIVEDLPAGMTENLAEWLDIRLYEPGSREPLQVPAGYALKNDLWYWVSNNAAVADSHKTVDDAGNPKVCRVYINVIPAVANSYVVRFQKAHADAEGSMDYQYIPVGDAAKLNACAYTLAGYTFAGWNTMPDGSGMAFSDAQTVQTLRGSGQAIDLYAQWKATSPTPDPEPEPPCTVIPQRVYRTYKNAVAVECVGEHHSPYAYSFTVTADSDVTMSPCGTRAYVKLSSNDVKAFVYQYSFDTKIDHEFISKIAPVITLKYVPSPWILVPGTWEVEYAAKVPVSCDCDLCCGHWHTHTVTYTDGVDNAVIFSDVKYTQKHGDFTKVPTVPTRPGYKFAGWTPSVSKYVHKCVTYTATWLRTDGPSLTTSHVAYLKGYGGGLVKPEGNITRAEAISILYRLMDAPSTKAYYTTYNAFTDVAKNAWYNDAVSTLANAGVLKSTTGLLNPDEIITRAEFFYMLTKFSGASYNGKCTFQDVPADHWAYEELALAQHLGWLKGYGGSTAKPDDTISRAEVAASLNRVLGRSGCALKDTKNYKDNPVNEWYYKDIVEASIAH